MDHLNEIAKADLTGSASISEMAQREGFWDPARYAIVLSENIRNSGMRLDMSRERLQALAQVAAGLAGDQASADVLSQHYILLESLMHRFSREAHEALKSDKPRASEVADRYLTAALKAQRAALATLSALKVLRDSPSTPTTTQPAPAPEPLAALQAT